MIVDAHLDLAYNAVRGCDVLKAAADRPVDDEGMIPSVGLPDLHAGGVGLICATIFCEPDFRNNGKGYRTAEEARAAALKQLEWYQRQTDAGVFRFVKKRRDLPQQAFDDSKKTLTLPSPGVPGEGSKKDVPALPMILLMEGADPIRTPDDVQWWFDAGLRMVGLAWRRTRFAGGTGAPGPLTEDGIELVRAFDAVGIIHDTSHLAEESFWQLLDLSGGPVLASHSNCRALVNTDRQLSDQMIRALVARGGVIGINFYGKFLIGTDELAKRRATLDDMMDHIKHMCDLAGSAKHVAIGTDLDGGFGREQLPVEIRTAGDLPKLADKMSEAGFADADVLDIMGGNWLRFFGKALPQ